MHSNNILILYNIKINILDTLLSLFDNPFPLCLLCYLYEVLLFFFHHLNIVIFILRLVLLIKDNFILNL